MCSGLHSVWQSLLLAKKKKKIEDTNEFQNIQVISFLYKLSIYEFMSIYEYLC